MPLFDGLGSGGEKTAVVIDLGAAYTKCGFAGETGPRFIIPSEIQKPGQQQTVKVVQYNINTEELYAILKEFIHTLYFRHLLVNPRDRRVVIIESILCPSHFRETLTKVFFKQFEVPSVLYAPSHLVAIMTLGINSALVMDCGYTETLVLPVYECTPILSAWEALPLGGKAIHSELNRLVAEQCTVDADSSTKQSVPAVIGTLSEKIVEDIKVRTCFVSDLQRGLKMQAAKFNLDGTAERPTPPPDVDYPLDGEKILHINGSVRYCSSDLDSCYLRTGVPKSRPGGPVSYMLSNRPAIEAPDRLNTPDPGNQQQMRQGFWETSRTPAGLDFGTPALVPELEVFGRAVK